ncbi:MAG: class I SAM-dependent methyltransferase [Nitrospirales bacterium]
MQETREPQYQDHLTLANQSGLQRLGLRANATWHEDPKRLAFVLSRYKFVAKMLSGKNRVLEVGCGDAFGSRIVLQEVESLCAIDFDQIFVNDVKQRMVEAWNFECKWHDILEKPVGKEFDGAYALDVLEHIPKEDEQRFMKNVIASLHVEGVLIIGVPSLQSQAYASEGSKIGHVNCKPHVELKALMQKYFSNVFLFSMNDEVVSTGFYPMAHYLFALCVGKRDYAGI